MATISDIRYVLFGVRFNHSFKLLDYWGEIADNLLYKSDYFNYNFFSNISTEYTTERSLYNPVTGNSLVLSSNNLVFKYYIPSEKKFEEEYNYFCERINKYLVPQILSKYNLVISRVGVVFACKLDDKDLEKFSEKYFKDDIQGITDFRFAQKEPTSSGKLWHGTDDYINKIYTVGKIAEDGFTGITYDFQLYYTPLQSDIRKQCPVFMKKGYEYFKKDVLGTGK